MVPSIVRLVRNGSLGKELERLGMLETKAFGNCETIRVEASTTLGRWHFAVEHLHGSSGARGDIWYFLFRRA